MKKIFGFIVVFAIVAFVLVRGGFLGAGAEISSIQPNTANPGDEIFVMGSGFGIAAEEIVVLFGSVSAKALAVQDDQIKVKVPPAAQSGLVSVVVGDVVSNNVFFKVAGGEGSAKLPMGHPKLDLEAGKKMPRQVLPSGEEAPVDGKTNPGMMMGGMMTTHAFFNSKDAKTAPEFELKNEKGKVVKLSDYLGKPVVVNFWATWCAPCLEEVPSLERLTQRASATNFEVLAISVNQSFEEIKKDLPGVKLNVLLDPKSETAKSYGTVKYPETFVVNAKGKIVAKFIGAQNWDSDAFERLLEMVATGKMPGDMMVQEN